MKPKQRRQQQRGPIQRVSVDPVWAAFTKRGTDCPIATFAGLTAAKAFINRLAVILGPGYVSNTEEGFCEDCGCPADTLEEWLRASWNVHNIQRVERLQEESGAFPLILIKQIGQSYRLRLYSPRSECFDDLPTAPKKWVQ